MLYSTADLEVDRCGSIIGDGAVHVLMEGRDHSAYLPKKLEETDEVESLCEVYEGYIEWHFSWGSLGAVRVRRSYPLLMCQL